MTQLYYVLYDEQQGYWWCHIDMLKTLVQGFFELSEEQQLEYQQDSPVAEYITGYNTDSFADESIDACKAVWDTYCDTCADEEREPNWQEYLDLCWEDFDYQCCHTWLRVTNIHLTDEQVKQAAYDSNSATMKSVLGF